MSAITSVRVGQEMDVETVEQMEDGLVEVGAVSEATKGGVFGALADTGGGGYKLS